MNLVPELLDTAVKHHHMEQVVVRPAWNDESLQVSVVVSSWSDLAQIGVVWGNIDDENARFADLNREDIDRIIAALVEAQARL